MEEEPEPAAAAEEPAAAAAAAAAAAEGGDGTEEVAAPPPGGWGSDMMAALGEQGSSQACITVWCICHHVALDTRERITDHSWLFACASSSYPSHRWATGAGPSVP
jgi:hypothetical protein